MTDLSPPHRAPWADGLLIVVFLAAVWMPLGKWIATPSQEISTSEKRTLAPPPGWPRSLRELSQFPPRFSAYYRDHFGFRAAFLRAHARLKQGLFHVSPSRFVLQGRGGWLYYADDFSLEDHRSLQPFRPQELLHWKTVCEERQTRLARRNIRFLLVLACDKHIIYPEYLPAGLERRPGPYRVDELASFLATHTSVPVVHLKPTLLAAKPSHRLYHRTDTHWNDAGAYIGYRAILNHLTEWFPSLQPLPPGSFLVRKKTTPGGDLSVMMGLDDILTERSIEYLPRTPRRARVTAVDRPDPHWNNGRLVTEVDDNSLPRALILRDSFGSALVPFLAEHFRRAEFLWQYELEQRHLAESKPDVVILLITSRRLQWYVPSNPPGE